MEHKTIVVVGGAPSGSTSPLAVLCVINRDCGKLRFGTRKDFFVELASSHRTRGLAESADIWAKCNPPLTASARQSATRERSP